MAHKYTLLKQNGDMIELGTFAEELAFKTDEEQGKLGLYALIGCRTIELIPEFYYEQTDFYKAIDKEYVKAIRVWGDEEGRFNSYNQTNKCIAPRDGYDVVGDVVLEIEL